MKARSHAEFERKIRKKDPRHLTKPPRCSGLSQEQAADTLEEKATEGASKALANSMRTPEVRLECQLVGEAYTAVFACEAIGVSQKNKVDRESGGLL